MPVVTPAVNPVVRLARYRDLGRTGFPACVSWPATQPRKARLASPQYASLNQNSQRNDLPLLGVTSIQSICSGCWLAGA